MEWVLPAILVFLPIAAGCLVMALPLSRRGCFTVSVVVLVLCCLIQAYALRLEGSWSIGFSSTGVLFGFQLDFYGKVLSTITLFIGLLIIVFSYDYLSPRNREHPVYNGFSRYYGLMLVFVGSMVGVSISSTLPALFVFYELTGVCSCLLISFYRDEESCRNGLEALLLTHIGGLCLLAASVLTYWYTGGLSLSSLHSLPARIAAPVAILFLIAALAKSAQLPFHIWLPHAMVAPTTVSAYLHAAAMVKVGVFTLLRFVEYAMPALTASHVASQALFIAGVAVSLATMFYGVSMYYAQRNLKTLLAYSTIVQLSYMILAVSFSVGEGSMAGVRAAIYHLWNHSFAKALLFLCAGAIAYATGSKSIGELRGLAFKRGFKPVALGWIAGSAAISGVPPFNCFYSKLAIISVGLHGPLIAKAASILAVVESLLCFILFMSLSLDVLSRRKGVSGDLRAPSHSMSIVLLVLAAMTLASPYIPSPSSWGW